MELDSIEFPPCPNINVETYLQERIVMLFFNLTRKTDNELIYKIRIEFSELLLFLKKELAQYRRKNSGSDVNFPYMKYINLIYKLIIHTRHTILGKGEHELFYMLIYEFYKSFGFLAVSLLCKYIDQGLGCWRDMKYLCLYIKTHSLRKSDDGLINFCVEIVNRQLKKDVDMWKLTGCRNDISNVAKWIPREKPRFKWLFDKLAIHWSNHYCRWKIQDICVSRDDFTPALNKCKYQYRRLISNMNKILETIEIKQCYQLWEDIDVSKVSKYTVMKQPGLFLCYGDDEAEDDEIIGTGEETIDYFLKFNSKQKCSQNYIEKSLLSADKNVGNGVGVGVGVGIGVGFGRSEYKQIIQLPVSYFVQEACRILEKVNDSGNGTDTAKRVLIRNWEKYCKQFHHFSFGNILPILDISSKMFEYDAQAFYVGLGLSILIAQKSAYGKRILALDNNPVWINLDETTDFLSIVEKVLTCIRSQNNTAFSFDRGIELIGSAIFDCSSIIKYMKLILFSNSFSHGNMDKYYTSMDYYFTLFRSISILKNKNSKNIYPNRYHLPKLIFWNLSKRDFCEIPSEKILKNCILVSGFSSSPIREIVGVKTEDTAYDFVNKTFDSIITPTFTPLRISNAQSESHCLLITAHKVGVLNVQRCN